MSKHAASQQDAPWWSGETAIALADTPRMFPPRPGGVPPTLGTVRRWVRHGVFGLQLRVFANGPTGLATTREEIERFIAQLSLLRGL